MCRMLIQSLAGKVIDMLCHKGLVSSWKAGAELPMRGEVHTQSSRDGRCLTFSSSAPLESCARTHSPEKVARHAYPPAAPDIHNSRPRYPVPTATHRYAR